MTHIKLSHTSTADSNAGTVVHIAAKLLFSTYLNSTAVINTSEHAAATEHQDSYEHTVVIDTEHTAAIGDQDTTRELAHIDSNSTRSMEPLPSLFKDLEELFDHL
jgi:hypothetical protein